MSIIFHVFLFVNFICKCYLMSFLKLRSWSKPIETIPSYELNKTRNTLSLKV